ncbi:MAG: hypothetical protein CMC35_09660 [Flavobacteriaceae bacterium]|nr:hypothetical protein [Flavobacteriaceae bacterium]|tara:strand:- start:12817 stop:16983 length:4167 start_codon:yes stop_codon:yes gene_type:complete
MKNAIVLAAIMFPFFVIAQSTDKNYIKKTVYQIPTTSGAVTEDEKLTSINYLDGLGRSIELISMQAGGNRENIINYSEYDYSGTPSRKYLPLAAGGAFSFDSSADYIEIDTLKHELFSFYDSAKYDNTPNPYSENRYEASPRMNVLETGAPGSHWALDPEEDDDHTIKMSYGKNYDDDVYNFSVSLTGNNLYIPSLNYDGLYPDGVLYKTVTKDENWQPGNGTRYNTEEYKNSFGQIVLKRNFVSGGQSGIPVDTYYVYDDYGNLTYVLSPEASSKIISGGNLVTNSQQIIDGLGYQYIYDKRNRLREKRIPGKGWESILYNNLDQPILTQDEELASDNKWLFTKYDKFGRVAYTGLVELQSSKSTLEQEVLNTTNYWETRTSTPNSIDDKNIYYTYNAYPTNIEDFELLTINYYDDYNVDVGNLPSIPTSIYGQSITGEVSSLPTVSHVRVLETSEWVISATAYDQKGRSIYTSSENEYLNSVDIVESLLDYLGKPIEVKTTHQKDSNPPITTIDYFHYDHQGRLISHDQKIDDEPVQLITENYYDELGQLVRKDVGGETFIDGYTEITYANVSFDGEITKDNGTSNNWDSGLKTKGEITADGGIRFRPTHDLNRHYRVGLVVTGNANPTWEDFDFSVFIRGNGSVDIEYGSQIYHGVETYDSNDIFSIERVGNIIYFRKNDNPVEIASYTFNNTDVLVGKVGLYSYNSAVSELELFGDHIDKKLQKIDYKYNVRGWLTEINDIEFSGFVNPDLFNFKINYTSVEGTASSYVNPLYNGNIAQTIWRTNNDDDDKHTYGYNYDGLNRLTRAVSYKGENLTIGDNHAVDLIQYDLNGNIYSLERRGYNQNTGGFSQWDDLNYDYAPNSNQLVKVTDISTSQTKDEGFKDVTFLADDYTYDSNGNLISDLNKGISSIEYNYLNLPRKVTFNSNDPESSGNKEGIIYVYDASGVKIEKQVFNLTDPIKKIEYAGIYMYESDTQGEMRLKFFAHPEGYVMPVAGTSGSTKGFNIGSAHTTYSGYEYVFQYRDHLGNIRLSYTDANLDGSIDPRSEIMEENNYYPFGLHHKGYNNAINGIENNYKTFQSRELHEDLGLGWIEFKYRMHDPTIGRFLQIDPVAERYEYNGVYNFSENRVIDGIDLEGLEYVTVRHYMLGDKEMKRNNILYYTQTNEEINSVGGTPRGIFRAASSGPDETSGVKHEYIDINTGKQVKDPIWEQRQNTTESSLQYHGLYSGAGSITDGNGNYDFSFQPIDWNDAIAKRHDQDYYNATDGYANYQGYIEDIRTYQADVDMVDRLKSYKNQRLNPFKEVNVSGVEKPFRTSWSWESGDASDGQIFVISALRDYKAWKINNNYSSQDSFETIGSQLREDNLMLWAIIYILNQSRNSSSE